MTGTGQDVTDHHTAPQPSAQTAERQDRYGDQSRPDLTFVWIYDEDTIGQGSASDFADTLSFASLSDYSIKYLYALIDGDLAKATWTVASSEYDEADLATSTVTITLPDGATAISSYRVDGRS